jgi:hypothetical protein
VVSNADVDVLGDNLADRTLQGFAIGHAAVVAGKFPQP